MTAEEFVIAWQSSASIDEVCEKVHISRLYAGQKAMALRRKGVPLKMMPVGRKKLDYFDLAELAKKSLNGNARES